MPLVLVKFIADHSPYNHGEIAGFRDVLARHLISLGRAVIFVESETPNELQRSSDADSGVVVSSSSAATSPSSAAAATAPPGKHRQPDKPGGRRKKEKDPQ